MTAQPVSIRLRTYQVGFGDCLLLTVTYDQDLDDRGRERHMLIDFGTKKKAPGGPSMAEIGRLIQAHCGTKLDVLVATHRHADHVAGFGDTGGAQAISALAPGLVVRPWPDAPDAEIAGDNSKQFAAMLGGVQLFAQAVHDQFAAVDGEWAERAALLGELGINNPVAVAQLEQWASEETAQWVKEGDTLDLETRMPGVRALVLGPPTLEQVPNLTTEADESDEYWLQMAGRGLLDPLVDTRRHEAIAAALATLAQPDSVGAASWLVKQLNDRQVRQLLGIVQAFDGMLNNTSIILLVEIGEKRLLLSGDAQIENWSYTLDRILAGKDPKLRKALTDIDLYKVGHHGSRNATPVRLYELWRDRTGDRDVVSVLSTLSKFFGKQNPVPASALTTALGKIGPLHSTEDLGEGVWWFDIEMGVATDDPLTYAAPAKA